MPVVFENGTRGEVGGPRKVNSRLRTGVACGGPFPTRAQERTKPVSPEGNLKTVRTIYDAFGRGDLATILDAVTDDVDWSSAAASRSAPWYGRRVGKDAVTEYFRSIGAAIEVLDFTQLSFTANDTEVMVLNEFRMRARRSGKEAAMHLHHYWRFRDGKVEYWRGSEDTEQTMNMLKR
jgi:ketosteroid isomerase-like protein